MDGIGFAMFLFFPNRLETVAHRGDGIFFD